jgi:hypothetical protein
MVFQRVKKWLLAITIVGFTFSGLTLAVPTTASAADETDLNGRYDNLLPNICQDGANRGGQSLWYYNVVTRDLHDKSYKDQYPVFNRIAAYRSVRFSLNPDWREIKGHCYYPASSSWTYEGGETARSESASNCDRGGPLNYTVNQNHTTTTTTTKTVGGGLAGTANTASKIFGLEAGAEFQYSWAYAKAIGWSRTVGMSVPAGRTEWMGARPVKRVVRVNPHFWIDNYRWNNIKNGFAYVNSPTWAGTLGTRAIVDRDYFYDGTSDVLKDGQPQFRFILHGRATTWNDCH